MNDATDRTGQLEGTGASRRFIKIAFTIVGVGALATTLFAVAQTRRLETNARTVVEEMLTSIRLVGQVENQVDRRRALVSNHIVATNPSRMAHLDEQIGAVDAEIAAGIRAYEPWVDLPGERALWERTRADLAILDGQIEHALELSRENENVEAWRAIDRSAAQSELVDHDFERLIAINNEGATLNLAAFAMIRHRLVLTLLGIGFAAVVGIFLVGRWAMREITRREEEMVVNANRLEARNKDLDAFAGRVAHDVRGNLTTIALAMTPLSAKVPRDDHTMQILRRGIGKMEALVEDLLALARVEAFVRGRCDPANVVAQVEQDLAPRIEAERGALRISVAHAEVACSEGLLQQAVTNLIDNAIKYHRPQVAPVVEISGAPRDGGYDLRVSDNGLGMSTEDAKRVFEPFYRSPQMRDTFGTGLGLSIVDRVVKASGGHLSLETELGHGSTFRVYLPSANGCEGDEAEAGA